jgi:transposase
MRTIGTPAELERRRLLAVERVSQGDSTVEVADFLGVDSRSVRRWVAAFDQHGATGLAARPVSGRPPQLSSTQEKIVRRWLADIPTAHGFLTAWWTAPRRGLLREQEFGIRFHPDSLTTWLRHRGYTPQRPRRVPRARRPRDRPRAG